MALAANVITLTDVVKRMDPDGKIADIVEMLSQTNEVLMDMGWKEGNLPTGHQTTVRTGLPSVFWRQFNQGVAVSKSTTAQVTEGIGMLEAWSEVDKDEAELNGNLAAFRLSEARPFLEAMNNEMASTLFYGNSAIDPEEFSGFNIRYSSLSAANAQNIVDAGGTQSDNSSIYLVVWGDQTVHGIYPKGSKAGLDHEDLGLTTVETSAAVGGSRMRAYQDRWQWKCGLVLKDWRYAVRICNIDISNLVAQSSNADLTEAMIKAMYRIPQLGAGKPVFYMNRTCLEFLDIQRRDAVSTGGQLSYEVVDGKRVASFRGIPIRVVDALLETESRVT